MKLTDEQYRALEPYEQNMRTALHQGYARNPGSRAIDMMQGIYNAVAKVKIRPNKGCNTCILNLLKDCGRLYFADKMERENRKVEVSEKKPGKRRKAFVAAGGS